MKMRREAAVAGRLLRWYARRGRDLPWRRTRDPYRIWIAEAILQQTRVEVGRARWARFVRRFPTVQALARAPLSAVLEEWRGLGYYARARNLHRAAREVVRRHRGRLPADPDALRALPGIGPYTAGAIASIAFGRDALALDGNGLRVLSRLFRLADRREVERRAEALLPRGRAGDFNQALMDLANLVCLPRRPRCPACPLRGACAAARAGDAERWPPRPARRKRPRLEIEAAAVVRAGRILLVRRPAHGLWGGLYEIPGRAAVGGSAGPLVAEARQALTHRDVDLRVFLADAPRRLPPGARWARARDLDRLPLPRCHLEAARRLLGRSSGPGPGASPSPASPRP